MKHVYKIIWLTVLVVFVLGILAPSLMNIKSTEVVFATVVAAPVVVLESIRRIIASAKALAEEQKKKESK